MITQNFVILLKEMVPCFGAKQSGDCSVNLGCGCKNPGTQLHCEECPYLEACLSRSKTFKASV